MEDTFRAGKALLATRPIFHKTDAGIRGHVFCTFLALVLRHELVSRLAPRRPKAIEWRQIVDDLADLSHVEVEQDGGARGHGLDVSRATKSTRMPGGPC